MQVAFLTGHIQKFGLGRFNINWLMGIIYFHIRERIESLSIINCKHFNVVKQTKLDALVYTTV